MARKIEITPNKTYASIENVVKAVEKKFPEAGNDGLIYFVIPTVDGRFFPVFTSMRSIQAGVHFHFNLLA